MGDRDETETRGATLAVDPFTSVNYVFGMLLGEEDFRADQNYHRGKTWLHNAWLHGAGVVWGFDVKYRTEKVREDGVEREVPRELEVGRGLALDGAGRELRLDETLCVVLADWYTAQRTQGNAGEGGDEATVDVDVVARFRACLGRDVPAIMEPCRGATEDTTPSRAYEQVSLDLRLSTAPEAPVGYRRLRLLLGVKVPALATETSSDQDRQQAEEDQKVVTLRAEALAKPPAERGPALMEAFRAMAALDVRELSPASEANTPTDEHAEVVLAKVSGLTFRSSGAAWVVARGGTLDRSVAPAHVATRAMQDLLAAAVPRHPGEPAGPRVVGATATAAAITVTFDPAIVPATVNDETMSVTRLDATNGWQDVATQGPTASADHKTLTFDVHLAVNDKVRLTLRGTGPKPVADAEGRALAGANENGPARDGQDHAQTITVGS